MFIPAYWWYSIQFISAETSVCTFKYRTHMNTLSIAPQLLLNILQNLNIKRDTLEKRAIVKKQFSVTSGSCGSSDSISNATSASASASSSSSSSVSNANANAMVAPEEYTPSIEDQYLPKSLRGTNNNPYSIMNAMPPVIEMSTASTPKELTLTEPSVSTNSPIEVAAAESATAFGGVTSAENTTTSR